MHPNQASIVNVVKVFRYLLNCSDENGVLSGQTNRARAMPGPNDAPVFNTKPRNLQLLSNRNFLLSIAGGQGLKHNEQ